VRCWALCVDRGGASGATPPPRREDAAAAPGGGGVHPAAAARPRRPPAVACSSHRPQPTTLGGAAGGREGVAASACRQTLCAGEGVPGRQPSPRGMEPDGRPRAHGGGEAAVAALVAASGDEGTLQEAVRRARAAVDAG